MFKQSLGSSNIENTFKEISVTAKGYGYGTYRPLNASK
jgi:hypothetical protein